MESRCLKFSVYQKKSFLLHVIHFAALNDENFAQEKAAQKYSWTPIYGRRRLAYFCPVNRVFPKIGVFS